VEERVNKLAKALNRLLDDSELAAPLAAVLVCASKRSKISYSEVEKIATDNLEDVLLLGNKWRLLIPTRVVKSGAWEDRPLVCEPGESYELPNAVRYLVQNASRTGCWDPISAITEVFREIEEPAWQQMSELVAALGKQATDGRISAVQIKQICTRAGFGGKVDVLIAELKAVGVMSPKLSPLAEVAQAGSPLYELNPSLFIKKGEKE
jgi:hypothetical protein